MDKSGQPAHSKDKADQGRSSLSNVTRVFLENSDFLKNFLKRFLSRAEDIDDLAQEAYLRSYRAEQERGVQQPKAYLFRVAKHLALNELNRKSDQMTVYIEERLATIPLDGKENLEEEVEAQQSVALYFEAVAALPKRCRRVFLLRKVNGMRQQAIADHLGITLSAVEKHLRNGTKSCRAYIDKANGEGIAKNDETLLKSSAKRAG
jgi:RNA polymerase sigma factor (sigma-70 family)